MKRTEVLFLALLFYSAPIVSQTAAPVIHTAQTAEKPPIPQTPQKPPGDDTGMTGQVAGSVVVPGVGVAVSATALFGMLGLVAVGALLVGSEEDDSPVPVSAPTTTR